MSEDAWKIAIDDAVASLSDELRVVRRHLHAHPEPSGHEHQTTVYLAERVSRAGLPVRLAPTDRGFVVDGGEIGGPRVAMRADMDALRIQDVKTVPYGSTVPGVMHGCGHDAHSAMLLGAALALHRARHQLPPGVSWRAIFQPAEEIAVGAREMIEAGAMDQVRCLIALHVDPELPAGWIGHRVGPFTARCEEMAIRIVGHGGHAGRPHHTVDPIAASAQLISLIYQQVPRAMDARDPVVVSFGTIQGGASANVIPREVELMGTIRTLGPESADRVKGRILRIAAGIEAATGVKIQTRFRRAIEAVVNDGAIATSYAQAASEVVGPGRMRPILLPSMGAEDFSGYLDYAPGAMFRLGVGFADRPNPLLHSPDFDIDESALAVGAAVLARAAVLLAIGSSQPENPVKAPPAGPLP